MLQPVFFIGASRSGTTIIFEAFTAHEQLGWLSNYNEKFPTMPFLGGLLVRLADNKFVNLTGVKKQYNETFYFNKLLPKPDEAYSFWNYYTKTNFDRDYLINVEPTTCVKQSVRIAVDKVLRWEGKKLFSAKLTGPSRIHFLKSIFPDAKFVHIIRDGRAVVHSMLNTHKWTTSNFLENPWWSGGLSLTDIEIWKSSNKDPAVLAAIQWKKIIKVAKEESIELDSHSYKEIKYEHFAEDPCKVLHSVYKFLELPTSKRASKFLRSQKITNMNYKYLSELPHSKVETFTKIMEPLLSELGYQKH